MQTPSDDPEYLERWVSLQAVIACRSTAREYAAVYDTIARDGIFCRGDFNRPRPFKPGSDEANKAMSLVSVIWILGDDEKPSPFGWPEANVPDFVEDPSAEIEKPVRPSARTKTLDSALVVIAALMSNRLDPNSRETVGKIENLATTAGLSISADTIRDVLEALPGAMARRKPKGR